MRPTLAVSTLTRRIDVPMFISLLLLPFRLFSQSLRQLLQALPQQVTLRVDLISRVAKLQAL